MRKLKATHLGQLRRMITQESKGFKGGEVRGSDLPIEYVAIFAISFIGVAGVLVMMQVKKAQSTLPIDNVKRND